ncbi:MAG TPA: hypothetical protein PKA63_12925 [Oligoflexia bacterium]|nr:hypothetical protein [Oligoflexia bacterium]HMP49562.1 hypothetical protein [Oligoflexia bacterium]
MGTRFLNIELEVKSKNDLKILKEGLGECFVSGFCGKMKDSDFYFLSGSMVSKVWDMGLI